MVTMRASRSSASDLNEMLEGLRSSAPSSPGTVTTVSSMKSRASSVGSLASLGSVRTGRASTAGSNVPGKLWLEPLDASDHWSNRLTTVPTKSSLVRQELFIEEAKAKFKAKKLLHSTMGDKNE